MPNDHELPPETIQKIKGFNEAAKIWSELEKGNTPTTPEDPLLYEEVISSLEFLKEKNLRQYTDEQENAQFEKVDAYIKQLREGEKR